jgi:hypothetical protein
MKRATENRAAQLITMAGYLARGAVKEELRARGFEPEYLEPAVISRLVRAYLQAHRAELIREAQVVLAKIRPSRWSISH